MCESTFPLVAKLAVRALQFSIFHVGIPLRALIRRCNDAITKNLPIITCLLGAYRRMFSEISSRCRNEQARCFYIVPLTHAGLLCEGL